MVSAPQMTHAPRGGGRIAGFSLMELMVVLTVMGILLGVAMPNFLRAGKRDTVESAAFDMQRQLSLARQKAISRRAHYRLTIDTGARTYQVERREEGTWVPDPAETFCWSERVNALLDIGGNGGNLDIEIEPQGTLLAVDAPARIRFANTCGDTATVSFVRTGRLRVRTSSS